MIFAIPAAATAMPLKPNTAAISAMIKKPIGYCSIISPQLTEWRKGQKRSSVRLCFPVPLMLLKPGEALTAIQCEPETQPCPLVA